MAVGSLLYWPPVDWHNEITRSQIEARETQQSQIHNNNFAWKSGTMPHTAVYFLNSRVIYGDVCLIQAFGFGNQVF